MGNDVIDRQTAIDAFEDTTYTKNEIRRRITELPSAQPDHSGDVNGKVSFTEKERGMLKKMRTLHNGTYADLLDRLVASAQPDLDSAYTEGYTAAESKYRKMWDEMPKIVYCRECMHREYCFSDVAMTNRSQTSTVYESIEYCSKGERRTDE